MTWIKTWDKILKYNLIDLKYQNTYTKVQKCNSSYEHGHIEIEIASSTWEERPPNKLYVTGK